MKLPLVTHATTGDKGDVFLGNMENVLLEHENNNQRTQNGMEIGNIDLFGTGIIFGYYTPPLLSIGTGLTVNIAPHTTYNGFGNKLVNSYALPIPPTAVRYIWERQTNTDAIPVYTLTVANVSPGTTDDGAILLGVCTTNGTNVTIVTEMFSILYPTLLTGNVEIIEHPATAWDGGATTRTGGTQHAFTTAQTIDSNRSYYIYRSGILMVEGGSYDYTRSGSTFTFVSGSYPISGEDVVIYYNKIANVGTLDIGVKHFSETILASALTDGGAAIGTYTLLNNIPAGALLIGLKFVVNSGFIGNVSCELDFDDTDRFIRNVDVFTTNLVGALATGGGPPASPIDSIFLPTAYTVNLSFISDSDITPVKAGGGSLTITFYYIQT